MPRRPGGDRTCAPTAHAQKPGKVLQASPPGQVMVVSANLKASFNNRYIRSSGGRMRTLTSRLLAHILERGGLYRPDVLLLQEALNRQLAPGRTVGDDLSATRVASELTRMTGDTYAIVVDPGKRQRPARGVSKETAIVANLETMEWPTAAGFVSSNAFRRKLQVQGRGARERRAASEPAPGLGRDLRARWHHLPRRRASTSSPTSASAAPRVRAARGVSTG